MCSSFRVSGLFSVSGPDLFMVRVPAAGDLKKFVILSLLIPLSLGCLRCYPLTPPEGGRERERDSEGGEAESERKRSMHIHTRAHTHTHAHV